jgi:site-specific DNA-methyltransferase (adenine-specific)
MAKSSGSEASSGRARRPTTTSTFGVSRRESHDATAFYDRFPVPEIRTDEPVGKRAASVDEIWVGDAREMDRYGDVADGSVALVVTSPPYYAGKAYETAIGEGHVPESYVAYLQMLEAVFEQCVHKLEPGGRIAVNVANLGRRPYRSLSADVIAILERLKLLIRGEVIWQKAKGAGGNCAWGSFQRPGNPVLRDLTERIIVASKGRFDRAVPARKRVAADLPSVATIAADEFMDLTTDVWEFAPESATRVGHPAPFPVELPRRFIDLYTYEDDLVLDPFMGSGSTAVAALRTRRRFVGFDTDPGYVADALARVEAERRRLASLDDDLPPIRIPAVRGDGGDDEPDFRRQAVGQGRTAKDVARGLLDRAGFTVAREDVKAAAGVDVTFEVRDRAGGRWYVDVAGAFSASRPGLRRADTLWKALGKASVLAAGDAGAPLLLLTTDMPVPGSAGAKALAAVRGAGPGRTVHDVVCLRDDGDVARLRRHAEEGAAHAPG